MFHPEDEQERGGLLPFVYAVDLHKQFKPFKVRRDRLVVRIKLLHATHGRSCAGSHETLNNPTPRRQLWCRYHRTATAQSSPATSR